MAGIHGGYRNLPPLDATCGQYALRCIANEDAEPIRMWRNAQLAVLRQASPISAGQQRRYFAEVIRAQMELAEPQTILVTVLRHNTPIGYGGLVHCAWEHRRAEISILFTPEIADDPVAYRSSLLAFLAMIEEIAFTQLGLNRLTLETYDIRPLHIGVLEEAGYSREGRLREHVTIDGQPVDSLLHAKLASARDAAAATGARMTSCDTRAIRMPAGGGS